MSSDIELDNLLSDLAGSVPMPKPKQTKRKTTKTAKSNTGPTAATEPTKRPRRKITARPKRPDAPARPAPKPTTKPKSKAKPDSVDELKMSFKALPDKKIRKTRTVVRKDKPQTTIKPGYLGGLKIRKPTEASFFDLLLYAEPGTGKTILAAGICEVPDMCPVLFVDTDSGIAPIASFYPEASNDGRIQRVEPLDHQDLENVVDELLKLSLNGELDFKTIVIDSFTVAEFMSMDTVLVETAAVAANKDNPREKDPDQPEQADYGKNRTRLLRIANKLRKVEANIIVVCHAKYEEQKVGRNINVISPALAGQLSNDLIGRFNNVWFLYTDTVRVKQVNRAGKEVRVEKKVRKLRTQQGKRIAAKDHTTKLPEIITDPTMKKIFELIEDN